MPDLNTAIKTRRKKLKKAWSTKEWDIAKKEFLDKNPVCVWCGEKSTVPHHPYMKSYTDGTYLNLYLSGCISLCQRCHFSLHRGLMICPVCKKKYMRVGSEMCYGCYTERHPEIEESRIKAKEDRKKAQKEYRQKKYQESKAKREKYLKEKNKGNV